MEKKKATKKKSTGTALSITFIINIVILSFHFGPLLGSAYAAETLPTNLTLQEPTIKTSDTSAGTGRRMTEVIGTPNFPVFPDTQDSFALEGPFPALTAYPPHL
jgi:hypothetical protein